MIREGNEILDYKLHKLGYKLIDPSVIFGLPIELLAKTFDGKFHTSPNTAMKGLWLNGGINDNAIKCNGPYKSIEDLCYD